MAREDLQGQPHRDAPENTFYSLSSPFLSSRLAFLASSSRQRVTSFYRLVRKNVLLKRGVVVLQNFHDWTATLRNTRRFFSSDNTGRQSALLAQRSRLIEK